MFDGSVQMLPEVHPTTGRELRAIQNTRSAGLAGARNTGVLGASGSLVAFLDDDDEWLPSKLRRQAELLAGEPSTAVAGCGNIVCYEDREVVRTAPRHVTFESLLRSRVAVLHSSTILVRRDAMLETIGLVDEDVPAGASEDYEWQLRAARHGPIAMVPEPLARIHWHAGSRFARHWESFIAGLTTCWRKTPSSAGSHAAHRASTVKSPSPMRRWVRPERRRDGRFAAWARIGASRVATCPCWWRATSYARIAW